MDKQKLKNRQIEILGFIQGFCAQNLDDEYLMLSDKMIQKLGRKRNSPLLGGQSKIWAASVIHALGSINFLFDKSTKPYATVDDISKYFGVSKSTVSGKSRMIRDLLDIWHFDGEFSTKRVQDSNPFLKMVMVDGMIMPIDSLPAELQAIVKQARAGGSDVEFHTQ